MPQEDAGLSIMSATTDQGITVTMTRQGAIGDLSTKYRWDVFYGLVNKQPQMTGARCSRRPDLLSRGLRAPLFAEIKYVEHQSAFGGSCSYWLHADSGL
jgi:hypothetical protein